MENRDCNTNRESSLALFEFRVNEIPFRTTNLILALPLSTLDSTASARNSSGALGNIPLEKLLVYQAQWSIQRSRAMNHSGCLLRPLFVLLDVLHAPLPLSVRLNLLSKLRSIGLFLVDKFSDYSQFLNSRELRLADYRRYSTRIGFQLQWISEKSSWSSQLSP